jgi:uncharacterized protein YecE (DUF72 family)
MTWQKEKKDVNVYFDNDQDAYAAFKALTLKQVIAKGKASKPRVKSIT